MELHHLDFKQKFNTATFMKTNSEGTYFHIIVNDKSVVLKCLPQIFNEFPLLYVDHFLNVYHLCIRLRVVNYNSCSYIWYNLASFIETDNFQIFCVKPNNLVSIEAILLIKIYPFYKNGSIIMQLNHRICYSLFHYICFSHRNWRCHSSKNII